MSADAVSALGKCRCLRGVEFRRAASCAVQPHKTLQTLDFWEAIIPSHLLKEIGAGAQLRCRSMFPCALLDHITGTSVQPRIASAQ